MKPFHGRMEVQTVNGVTGLVEVGPGSVPLPDDGLAPGPDIWPPVARAGALPLGPNLNGPFASAYGLPA